MCQRLLTKEKTPDLGTCIKECIIYEMTQKQAQKMQSADQHAADLEDTTVCLTNTQRTAYKENSQRYTSYPRKAETRVGIAAECRYCGQQHQQRQCPAYGKICRKCGKKNHFANVCRSRDIQTLDQDEK